MRRAAGQECASADIRSAVDVMTAAYEDVPFSELLHHPAATTRRIDAVRALRLRRRDAGDLALMRVEQMERDATVVDFSSRLLTGLVRTDTSRPCGRPCPRPCPGSPSCRPGTSTP
ncbi:hypothetical protein GCM10018781_80280 [Kitasatospora indigofera]|uniref:Uncharacterized protein n=1 Tax=Kitasatospora indigofera TaxID=67307 RepID=A0A918YZH8_9ACTN|nr:hypothetical protein GCM10018781_80280 [Kitasatospora indigofera]